MGPEVNRKNARGLHPPQVERIRIANLLLHCAIMAKGISCSAAVILPGFPFLVSHGASCRVGTGRSQAHRLQATVG